MERKGCLKDFPAEFPKFFSAVLSAARDPYLLRRTTSSSKLIEIPHFVRDSGKKQDHTYSLALLNRNAFAITETELKLIAAAANTGCSSRLKNGYRIPAAIGTPSRL